MKEVVTAFVLIAIFAMILLACAVIKIDRMQSAIKNSGYKIDRTYNQKTGEPIDRLIRVDEAEKFGGDK